MNCNIRKCGNNLSNLGHECTSPFGVAAMVVFVPTRDSDGNLNVIPKTQTLNKAYFDSMVGHADPTKRWYPSPLLKNVENTRGDAKFWTADDQSVEFVSETARVFKALITQVAGTGATSPAMKQQIESARCSEGLSVFLISEKRQILCKESADGDSLRPIVIDDQSVYAGFVFGNKEQNQHIGLQFNFSAIEEDGDLTLIDCSEISDYDLLMMKALLGICYELIDKTDTTLTIKLKSKFGTAINPDTADGLVVADFISSDDAATSRIWNETDQANVTITGVVESPEGTYELTFAAQDPGDVLIPFAKKTGYDFSCMKDNPVAIESES